MMSEGEWKRLARQRREPWRWTLVEQAKVRDILIRHQRNICAICGGEMEDGTMDGRASLDHVIPKALGGADRLGNLVAAHRGCNGKKGSDPPTGCTLVWLLVVNNRLGVEPMRW